MPYAATRRKHADAAFAFILDQLENLNETDSPLQRIACLFVMKEFFAKQPMPSIAKLCYERNIITTLMQILGKEFHPDEKTNEAVLYSVAMELIWNFSSLERKYLDPLVSEPLLALLVSYLDVGHSIYKFLPALATKLHSLCCNTLFPCQKVTSVPMTPEIWQDVLHYSPDMAAVDTSFLYCCNLTTKLTNKNQQHHYTHSTIAKQLISTGLAWPPAESLGQCQQCPEKNIAQLIFPEEKDAVKEEEFYLSGDMLWSGKCQNNGEEDNTQDIFFLRSVGGAYFWAYVGTDIVGTVRSISDLLMKELPELTPCIPHKGDLVAVVVEVEAGQEEVRRGRVVEVGKDRVKVLAVDHGSVHTVLPGRVYQITGSATHLKKFDAQAKLCCLTGIQAPPVEEAAVELTLCTFVNLTKHFKTAGQFFMNAGGLKHLQILMCCPSATLQLQVVRLLANLTSISCCQKTNLEPFIRNLIEILRCIMRKEDLDSRDRNTIVSALCVLTNIMLHRPKYRNTFFDLQGQIVVLNMMRLWRSIVPIIRAASILLKTVYPGLLKAVPERKNCITENQPGKAVTVEDESGHRYNGSTTQDDALESSDDEINAIMEVLLPKPAMTPTDKSDGGSDGGGDSESRLTVEPLVTLSPHTNTCSALPATDASHAADVPPPEAACQEDTGGLCQSQGGQETPANSIQFVPVDGGAIYDCLKNSGHFYEYNSFLPYRDDITHHLWETDDINHVKFEELASIICGMLNVEGGKIFFGLSKTGCVQGLTLDRNIRDCIRLMLDRLNYQVEPIVSHSQIHLRYVEVGQRTQDGEMKHLCDRYVIEIIVRAPWELMFYCTGRPRKCYVRNHTTNSVLSEQDVRQLIVLDEERRYLPKIQQLRQRIEEIRKRASEI